MSRHARFSNVRMYRSDANASYAAPTGVRRKMPRDGLAIPDSDDGGQSPQTLKSLRRDLNGSTRKSAADSRCACGRNVLAHSAAV